MALLFVVVPPGVVRLHRGGPSLAEHNNMKMPLTSPGHDNRQNRLRT
jgi:hypothetical protein